MAMNFVKQADLNSPNQVSSPPMAVRAGAVDARNLDTSA
jgi:hypothetical protein